MRVLQTPALPLGYVAVWSGKRGSNSRPPPWQGGALPLSYFRMVATRRGLEPLTSAVTGRHSNQLNYRAIHRCLQGRQQVTLYRAAEDLSRNLFGCPSPRKSASLIAASFRQTPGSYAAAAFTAETRLVRKSRFLNLIPLHPVSECPTDLCIPRHAASRSLPANHANVIG